MESEIIEEVKEKKKSSIFGKIAGLGIGMGILSGAVSAINLTFITDMISDIVAGKDTYMEGLEFGLEVIILFAVFGILVNIMKIIVDKLKKTG